MCFWPGYTRSIKKSGAVKHTDSLKYEEKPVGTNYFESYDLTCLTWNIFLCTFLLLSSWQYQAKSLHSLLFYSQPFESLVDGQGYLPISLPSCFTAADFVMALNSLDESVVPKKKHCCIFFFFCHPNERGWDINRLEEKQSFSAQGWLGFIALHKKLIGGLFCARVNFTADCVYWSSRKTK